MSIPDLRYPIGPYAAPTSFSAASRAAAIASIAELPARLRSAVDGLNEERLDTPYRPEGWTLRQVVHHVADAHLVLYARAKTALTEDNPPVKTWDEVRWAEFPDARSMPIAGSLAIVDAVHARFVHVLRALTPEEFARLMTHPDWGVISVDRIVDLCAWHGAHHAAHVSSLRARRGWGR